MEDSPLEEQEVDTSEDIPAPDTPRVNVYIS